MSNGRMMKYVDSGKVTVWEKFAAVCVIVYGLIGATIGAFVVWDRVLLGVATWGMGVIVSFVGLALWGLLRIKEESDDE